VHAALLPHRESVDRFGLGQFADKFELASAIFDPATGTITTQPVSWDMFCNGMVLLPDGRAFVNSGTLQYDPFHGHLKSAIYESRDRAIHGRAKPWRTGAGIRL